MKNRIGVGGYLLLSGVLVGTGPKVLFKVCEPGEAYMKCWWSSQALIGMGLLLAMLGICNLFFQSLETQLGIVIAAAATAAITILIPSVLIGGCMKKTMACIAVTFPCIYAIGVITIVVAGIRAFHLIKQVKKDRVQ